MTELCLFFLEKSFCSFIKIQIYKRLSNPQHDGESCVKGADAQCSYCMYLYYSCSQSLVINALKHLMDQLEKRILQIDQLKNASKHRIDHILCQYYYDAVIVQNWRNAELAERSWLIVASFRRFRSAKICFPMFHWAICGISSAQSQESSSRSFSLNLPE